MARELLNARLHGEAAQGFHTPRANLENGITCKWGVQVWHRTRLIIVHLMRHGCWPAENKKMKYKKCEKSQ
jgi:hypothetical protein